MPEPHPTLRAIAWGALFPWSNLVRCWRLSLSPPLLLVATLAVLIGPLGSWLAGHLFLDREAREAARAQEIAAWQAALPSDGQDAPERATYQLPRSAAEFWGPVAMSVNRVIRRLTGNWQWMLTPPGTIQQVAYLVLGGLWSLVVWSLAAGTMTRVAVWQLGCDRRLSIADAARFVLRRFQSYVAAPLIPLAPLILALIGFSVMGWIGQSGLGLLLVGLAWPFVLLLAIALTVLFLGLAIGWPLMWVALGAEVDADAFEAISRGYTYALQRPFRLLGYLAVALLVGALGWGIVFHVSEILLAIAASGLNPMITQGSADALAETGILFRSGAWLIRLGNGLVRIVALSYGYSFFFCAASAIYLLLRRDIDEAEFDQLADDQEEEPLDLPPLPADIVAAARRDGASDSEAGRTEENSSSTGDEPAQSRDSAADETPPPDVPA